MALGNKAKIALVLFLFAFSSSLFAVDYDESDEAWATYLDLRIIDVVLTFQEHLHPQAEDPEHWTSLEAFAKELPELSSSRLPTVDGWGQKLMVGKIIYGTIVISPGEDGVADSIETFEELAGGYYPGRRLAKTIGDDMVLWVGDRIMNKPRSVLDRQKEALADLRSIGTAMESYAIDNDKYPRQVLGLQDVGTVEESLEPIYIRTLPKEDPWGNDFLIWSDETDYMIISMGSDGLLDRAYDLNGGALEVKNFLGAFEDPETDLIFADGQFLQWPSFQREQVVRRHK
jgi:hypothetical protein